VPLAVQRGAPALHWLAVNSVHLLALSQARLAPPSVQPPALF